MIGASIHLEDSVEVVTATGAVFRIEPGRGGRGLLIVPVSQGRADGRGRPPMQSTLKLREALAADAASGRVKEPAHYMDLIRKWDPETPEGTVRTTVSREMGDLPGLRGSKPRPNAKRAGRSGRPPRPSTLKLRERLAADAAAGQIHAPRHYIELVRRWDPGVDSATLRQIVYRERRAAAHPGATQE